jgi:pre-mRNA-splicing helicase BRR2
MQVTLEKEEEDEGDALAIAPFFPHKKLVNWWLVVGDPGTKNLLGIKRVTVAKTLSVKLEFTLPQVSRGAN